MAENYAVPGTYRSTSDRQAISSAFHYWFLIYSTTSHRKLPCRYTSFYIDKCRFGYSTIAANVDHPLDAIPHLQYPDNLFVPKPCTLRSVCLSNTTGTTKIWRRYRGPTRQGYRRLTEDYINLKRPTSPNSTRPSTICTRIGRTSTSGRKAKFCQNGTFRGYLPWCVSGSTFFVPFHWPGAYFRMYHFKGTRSQSLDEMALIGRNGAVGRFRLTSRISVTVCCL